MSASVKRKWSSSEKLRIVLEGMSLGVSVAEMCRREGGDAEPVFLWKKQLLGAAGKIFDAKSGRPSAAETKTAADVARFNTRCIKLTETPWAHGCSATGDLR